MIDSPSSRPLWIWSNCSFLSYAGVVVVEDRVPASVLDGLARRGHEVQVSDPWSLGRMCAVSRDPRTGVLRAGANPRGMQGYAVGR